MIWMCAALVLLVPQEGVSELVKRIDGRDVAATFRAIDDLADLGPERRAEIEKAAEKLPEFYRDALRAELRIPVSIPRVSLKDSKPTLQQFLEWSRQSGIRISNYESDGSLKGDLELSLDRTHALEALGRICGEHGYAFHQHPLSGHFYLSKRESRFAALGRRSATVVFYDSWKSRRQDFGGDAAWRLLLKFETALGAEARPVCWDRIRIYEAVGNGGVPLCAVRPERKSLALDSVTGGRPIDTWHPKLDVKLEIPDGVFRIDRLRFAATGLVSHKHRYLEVPGNREGPQSRGGFEVEVAPSASMTGGNRNAVVRIRTADPSLRKLLPALYVIELDYGKIRGSSSIDYLQEIDGGVEAEIAWRIDYEQLRKGPCRCVGCCSCFHFEKGEVEAACPKGLPERIRIRLPDDVRERTIFAEFRDLFLW